MLYDNVYLKGPRRTVEPSPSFRIRRLWILWRHDQESRAVGSFL